MQPATSQLSGKTISSNLSRTSPSHLFCRSAISRLFCVFSPTIGNLHPARDTPEALLNPIRLASEGQQRMLQCPPKEALKRKADIPMGSKDCWAELRRSEAEHPCWKRMRELLCPKQAER